MARVQSCANHVQHSGAYCVQHVCHVARRDSSAIQFDRAEIGFVLAILYRLRPPKVHKSGLLGFVCLVACLFVCLFVFLLACLFSCLLACLLVCFNMCVALRWLFRLTGRKTPTIYQTG